MQHLKYIVKVDDNAVDTFILWQYYTGNDLALHVPFFVPII